MSRNRHTITTDQKNIPEIATKSERLSIQDFRNINAEITKGKNGRCSGLARILEESMAEAKNLQRF